MTATMMGPSLSFAIASAVLLAVVPMAVRSVTCSSPTLPPNLYVSQTFITTVYGKEHKLHCFYGYRLIGDQNITCHSSGTWDVYTAKCDPCERNGRVANGKLKPDNTLACDSGFRYQRAANNTECDFGTCRTCPGSVRNGKFGVECHPICNEGFHLVNGECKACDLTVIVANGKLNSNYSVTCRHGYFYKPSVTRSNTHCDPGTCEEHLCGPVSHDQLQLGLTRRRLTNSSVEYELHCKYGYRLNRGQLQRHYVVCPPSHNWTAHTAVCEPCYGMKLANGNIGKDFHPTCDKGFRFVPPSETSSFEQCHPGVCTACVSVANGRLHRNNSVTCDSGYQRLGLSNLKNTDCQLESCTLCPGSIRNGKFGANDCRPICDRGFHFKNGDCQAASPPPSNRRWGIDGKLECLPGHIMAPESGNTCIAACPLPLRQPIVHPQPERAYQNTSNGQWLYKSAMTACPKGEGLFTTDPAGKAAPMPHKRPRIDCQVSNGVARFPHVTCKACARSDVANGSLSSDFTLTCHHGFIFQAPAEDDWCSPGRCINPSHCPARVVENGRLRANCSVECDAGTTRVTFKKQTICAVLCPFDLGAQITNWSTPTSGIQHNGLWSEYEAQCPADHRLVHWDAQQSRLVSSPDGKLPCKLRNGSSSLDKWFCTPCHGSIAHGTVAQNGAVVCNYIYWYNASTTGKKYCSALGKWHNLGQCSFNFRYRRAGPFVDTAFELTTPFKVGFDAAKRHCNGSLPHADDLDRKSASGLLADRAQAMHDLIEHVVLVINKGLADDAKYDHLSSQYVWAQQGSQPALYRVRRKDYRLSFAIFPSAATTGRVAFPVCLIHL